MEKEIPLLIKELVGEKHIKIAPRGNKAILYALRIAKKLNKTRVFIQDQGGWLTYKQLPKKLKLQLIELKTDYGIISQKDLEGIDNNSVLLINSLPGYFAEQQMAPIYNICKSKGCLLINDISGSIGTEQAKYGDILVCSFGSDKPLNYGKYGLLAVKNKDWFKLTEIKEEKVGDDFKKTLKNLPKRLSKLKEISKKIKNDLKKFDMLHKEKNGINVIVKFNNESEKKEVEDYCKNNSYQYTVCPRYIRVNCNAVSIEVKRL